MERRPVGYVVPDPINEPLYVVTPVFNPLRWKSRYKLYERFAKHVADSGGILYTGEVSFGEREHSIDYAARHGEQTGHNFTEGMAENHRIWHFRTSQELWMKEAVINAMVQRLPADWKYVAWIDADTLFLRPNWVGECIHQLQHYDFLQMFSVAQDLGPDYEVIGSQPSFMYAFTEKTLKNIKQPQYYYPYYAPRKGAFGAWSGLAWACTRRAWNAVGGLMDWCITGAADWYMAWSLIGKVQPAIPKNSHPEFAKKILQWQEHAERNIRRNVGVMTGTVSHMFHGRKKDRKYYSRSKFLADVQFDPSRQLTKDWQGLPILRDDGSEQYINLRDGIRDWMRSRNEDVNEV
jgi:hypothetical protein